MNRVFLIGRLGQDPELRQGKGGTAWAVLGVATNRARKEGDAWVEETDWHDVKVFGTEAERVHRLAQKGSMVAVEGMLVYDSWTDDQGNKKRKAKVIGQRVQILTGLRPRDGAGVTPMGLGPLEPLPIEASESPDASIDTIPF